MNTENKSEKEQLDALRVALMDYYTRTLQDAPPGKLRGSTLDSIRQFLKDTGSNTPSDPITYGGGNVDDDEDELPDFGPPVLDGAMGLPFEVTDDDELPSFNDDAYPPVPRRD